ncbi:hypothetical protein [Acinetobacter baumannii]|uniref:hypothetical protein n=1 Tax=Acinetobacter baumannii TaxID=470 RepID=UPI003AF8D6E1
MTDLNKEREAFLNTFQYYKGRRDIIFSNKHELFMTRSNNPSEIAQKEISNMNRRWDAWLRCAKHRDAELEKAKAQAVPEGYVLMPKVPSEKMFQAYERYSVAPMSTLSKTGYKAMVEAASESGAEK